jgi:general secretion pathway protein E
VGGHEVDVRVSTIPSQYGERVVLRLLDRDATRLGLDALGMSPRDRLAFERLLGRPDGILLVTGPTGSGKTTTLYAALGRLNDRSRNIMTVEDPIEYSMDGVGQTQVNPQTGADLRARPARHPAPRPGRDHGRRDPRPRNGAGRGRVRDDGHFVLSTLHTNTAVGAVSRLIDMGVERFLLAPMLAGVVAQRLVRRLCPDCSRPRRRRRRPTARCSTARSRPARRCAARSAAPPATGSATADAVGLYEVVTVDAEMEALIHAGAAEAELVALARRQRPEPRRGRGGEGPRGLTTVEDVGPGGAGALMAAFTYRAVDRGGRAQTGVLEAASAAPRARICARAAFSPVEVAASRSGAGSSAAGFSLRPAVGARDLTLLTRQLATLIGSGVRIDDALRTVASQAAAPGRGRTA